MRTTAIPPFILPIRLAGLQTFSKAEFSAVAERLSVERSGYSGGVNRGHGIEFQRLGKFQNHSDTSLDPKQRLTVTCSRTNP